MGRAWLPLLLLLSLASPALPGSGAGPPGPILIPAWKMVGPFEAGAREGFVHHLAGPGGHVPATFTCGETWPSVLADGGRAGWSDVEADRDQEGNLTGRVSIQLEGVDWEARQAEWGFAGLLNIAYLYGEFTLEEPGTFLLEAERCAVSINGVPFRGDPYGHGITKSVVRARKGANRVLVRSARFGGERWFEFRLRPIEAGSPEVMVLARDVLLPDLVEGEKGEGWAGVPLLNLTDRWLDRVTVSLDGAMQGSAVLEFPLAPYAPLKVPVRVRWDETSLEEGQERKAEVRVTAYGPGSRAVEESTAEVRAPGEARAVTFQSRIDRSAQFYGLLPPKDYEPGQSYSLILSTHGAGVNARGQAASHATKDWAFVVAPTNRRPFGFDWHDWGRLDFEEVLDLSLERYPVDPARVHLVGHSMGGHGAWILGVHHADRLASLAPSAGWIGHDTYVPTTLRRSRNLAAPGLAGLYLRGVAADKASTFLENLLRVPVLIIHGAKDDNVPPTHARLMAGALEGYGHTGVTLREVPGEGHWWDADKDRSGADCVDAAWMESFWKASEKRQKDLHQVTLVTVDPDVNRRMHWVTLLEPERTAQISRIEARRPEEGLVQVRTANVARFRIDMEDRVEFRIDGQRIEMGREAGPYRFRREFGRWLHRAERSRDYIGPADHPGGLKKTLYEPFLIVVATGGEAARNEHTLQMARLMATTWWRRANGRAPIVRDVDLNDGLRARYNLVLLGGPEINLETRALADDLNIATRDRKVLLADREVPGRSLVSAHWQPNPRAKDRRILVYQSTDAGSDSLLPSLIPIGSGIGLPDYVIMGHAARLRAWGGFVAAGYWDQAFRFDPGNGWRAFP